MHPWFIDREWQSGLFSQGQSIHVGTQQDDSTLTGTSGLSPQDDDHSRRIFVFDDLYAERSEFAHHYRLGLGELEAQLGNTMQSASEGHQVALELAR
jgi:hypothetical protein